MTEQTAATVTRRPALADRCDTAMIRLTSFDGGRAVLRRPDDADARREMIEARGWLGKWWEFEPDPEFDGDAARVGRICVLDIPFGWPFRRMPSAADIMRPLLQDAATWLDTDSYESWLGRLGLVDDEDEWGRGRPVADAAGVVHRSRRDLYAHVGRLVDDVRVFLGEELFAELLQDTPDL